ncbi:TIGR03066 family protein [Frigoriglobus tundricola]|uniref:Lipocalin-like domain-containing protein n=1 Tax=Frigoriglobus tundricola TaxID=2774151 RepID=A0A6M5YRT8_9BACT|nr:TIGR03066 family protein [Frigoriglobus tundricola]QJW96797.1 hypothetical protein FTUN_4356 [Frigoriglobus tundricola]
MRVLFATVAALVMVGFAGAADEKIDAKKLIGKWEPKDAKKGEDFVMEFAEKGKLIVTFNAKGKETKFEGTYKLEGNKIEVAMSLNGKEVKEAHTVTKLTDDELVSTDPKGKEETLKRVKK